MSRKNTPPPVPSYPINDDDNFSLFPQPLRIRKPSDQNQATAPQSEIFVKKKRSNINLVTGNRENVRISIPQRRSSLKLQQRLKSGRLSDQKDRGASGLPADNSESHISPHENSLQWRVVSRHRILNRLASGFSSNSGASQYASTENVRPRKNAVLRRPHASQSSLDLGSLLGSFPAPPPTPTLPITPLRVSAPGFNHTRNLQQRTSPCQQQYRNPLTAAPCVSLVPSPLAIDPRGLPKQQHRRPHPSSSSEHSTGSASNGSRSGSSSSMEEGNKGRHEDVREQHLAQGSQPYGSDVKLAPIARLQAPIPARLATYHRRRETSHTIAHESWRPELRIIVEGWTVSTGIGHQTGWQSKVARSLRQALHANGIAVSDVYFELRGSKEEMCEQQVV